MKKTILTAIVFLPVLLSCFSTTRYFTGRTLESGQKDIIFGLDGIAIVPGNGYLPIRFPLPSVGWSFGLPWRFEAGVRWYLPFVVQPSVRWQINPRTFTLFDCSLYAGQSFWLDHGFEQWAFRDAGIMVSKRFEHTVPYAGLFGYQYRERGWQVYDDLFAMSAALGCKIQARKGWFYPEISWILSDSFDKRYYVFNLGFRTEFRLK